MVINFHGTHIHNYLYQVDIFEVDLILVPVHLGAYWALAVVDNQKCQVEYYDSLQCDGASCLQRIV